MRLRLLFADGRVLDVASPTVEPTEHRHEEWERSADGDTRQIQRRFLPYDAIDRGQRGVVFVEEGADPAELIARFSAAGRGREGT